ncbi:hypothetical protein PRZ48_000129 [Zasmidium cellare]|uniref:Succinate-semialdehyde dehydrogenase, mitochondrial n=1 Tax=Zasmidium cellare TaxID=395010 RepID=A0ABR0EYD4_ZASCE|nr:hypothetical protein PRZ48_000129 [Zasmidium cellare]
MASIQLNNESLLRNAAYINGKWIPATTGKTFNVTDPATEQVIGTMPDMGAKDTDIAIQAAAAALPRYRKTTARSKSQILHKWYQLLVDSADDLARLVTAENGKPLHEAKNEVLYAAHYFEWFSGEATRLDGETIHASEDGNRIYTIREPIGVVGLVTPWNWPLGMVTRKIGPALAAGCTVVLKSPGETPLTAAAMVYLGEQAGVPPGVVNVVTALENTVDVGAALTESPTVKKVSFTGSTRVGKILMKQSADTLKKLSFELGGNAPFIVFEDADFDAAVAGAVACKFRSSGQTCICANRIYVHRSIYDKFAQAFAEKVSKFTIGPGSQPGTTHGPLIHSRAMDKAKEHTEDALRKGGKLLVGGHALPISAPTSSNSP